MLTDKQIERERERRDERERQGEWDFKEGLPYPHNYKEEYPEKKLDIQDYYYDQAPRRMDLRYLGGPCISSIVLPYGLQQMEGWMIRQIIHGSKFTKKELAKMIKHNLHLHNVIKTNLLFNLNNRI